MPLANVHSRQIIRDSRKKIRTVLHGLRPSGIYGRFAAPAVLLNSIPKAGTHLLETALERYPRLRNAGRRTVSTWNDLPPSVISAICSIGKGAFLNAHVPAHRELLELVAQKDIRVLFMIRDPRDIVVSHFKYVTSIDRVHRLHSYYAALPDDDARLMASIVGIAETKPSIGEILDRFGAWMDIGNTLVCRFEDLIGPNGGGSREAQYKITAEISRHLDIKLSRTELERIAAGIFSSKSSTFRKGRLGVWREFFKDEHTAKFKKIAGDAIIRYGYENDGNW